MAGAGANLKLPRYKTVLLNSGGLLYSVWFCFALIFASRISQLVGITAALITVPLCCVAAAALVPLAYFIVNKNKSKFWGRYHFILAAAVLIMALCCATLWSAESGWAYGAKITAACISMLLLGVCAVLLTYVMYSVNARLGGEESKPGGFKTAFQTAGFIIGFGLTVLCLRGFALDGAGYLLSCLILAVGGALYFASVSYIPRFMRPLTRKVSLKGTFAAFFKRPTVQSSLSFISYFAANALTVISYGFISRLCSLHGFYSSTSIAVLSAAVAAGLISYVWGIKKRFTEYAAVTGGVGVAAAAAALAVLPLIVQLSTLDLQLCLAGLYALIGFGAGLTLSAATVKTDKLKDNYSVGVFICLKGMTLLCAMGLGIALSAALLHIDGFTVIIFACIVGALSIAAAAMLASARRLMLKGLKRRAESQNSKDGQSGSDVSADSDNQTEAGADALFAGVGDCSFDNSDNDGQSQDESHGSSDNSDGEGL